MRNWILEQLALQGSTLNEYLTDNQETTQTEARLFGPMHSKVLVDRVPREGFDPNVQTWLGGTCSLFTGDSEAIRTGQQTFASEDDFYRWLKSWYPRLDQVHDTLAIPPRACRRAIYVVEDSFFGRRLAKWTGLREDGLSLAFRTVHQEYGAGVIQRWLQNYGWQGQVEVVYTSQLEDKLDLALTLWEEDMGKHIRPAERDRMKVDLMYTPIWLRILGLKQGVVAEPFHHGTQVKHRFVTNGMSFCGFTPFWSAGGATRLLPYSAVTHRGNWREFQAEPGWSAVNLAFTAPNPLSFSPDALNNRTLKDLAFIYGESAP